MTKQAQLARQKIKQIKKISFLFKMMMKTLLFKQREIEKVVVRVYIYSYVCELQNVSALSPLLKSVFDASLSGVSSNSSNFSYDFQLSN